jgi:pilus assembly protein CpaC
VVLAQVNRTEERQMGFDWLLSSHNTIIGSQTAGAVGSVSPIGLMSTTLGPNGALTDAVGVINGAATNALFGVLNPDHRWAYLQFLNALRNENLAKLLAEPRLVTLSGKEANFLSGGQTPVPTAGGLGIGGTDFVPFGTSLNFLPIVLGNGRIYLEVETEVSELAGVGQAVSINGTLVQPRNTERVRTAVELEPGQTLMIGGLIQRTTATATTKLPVLGDVPFFGVFFRNIFNTESEQELVILVTPHLVDGMSCDQLPKLLPGQETRTPDDFELFLEGILEAPRGQREPFAGWCYHAAWTAGPTADKFPCGGNSLGIFGHPGSDGCCGGCGSIGLGGGCSKGGCGGCANGSCGAGNVGGDVGLDAPPPFPSGMPQQSLPTQAGVQQTSVQELSPAPPRGSGMGPRPVVLPSDAGRH